LIFAEDNIPALARIFSSKGGNSFLASFPENIPKAPELKGIAENKLGTFSFAGLSRFSWHL
jgi:hypothetical protein